MVLPELAFTVIPMLLAKVLNHEDRLQSALLAHKALEMISQLDGMKRQDLAAWANSLKRGFDRAFVPSTEYEILLRSFINYILGPLAQNGREIWLAMLPPTTLWIVGGSSGYPSDREASHESGAGTPVGPSTPLIAPGSPTDLCTSSHKYLEEANDDS